MRREDREIRDGQVLDAVIRENSVCRLGMVDGTRPYVISMNYGYYEGNIYLHSAASGRKLDLLAVNSNVCIEITDSVEAVVSERACGFSTRYRSVLLEGTAEILKDPREKRAALQHILSTQTGRSEWAIPEASLRGVVAIRVAVSGISGKSSF